MPLDPLGAGAEQGSRIGQWQSWDLHHGGLVAEPALNHEVLWLLTAQLGALNT